MNEKPEKPDAPQTVQRPPMPSRMAAMLATVPGDYKMAEWPTGPAVGVEVFD